MLTLIDLIKNGIYSSVLLIQSLFNHGPGAYTQRATEIGAMPTNDLSLVVWRPEKLPRAAAPPPPAPRERGPRSAGAGGGAG